MKIAHAPRFLTRFTRSMRSAPAMAAAALTPILMQGSAMAQDTTLRPPRVNDAPSAPKIIVYLVIIIVLAGVVFAATLKSKRGHQD